VTTYNKKNNNSEKDSFVQQQQNSRSLLGLDEHPTFAHHNATEDYLRQDNEKRLDLLAEKAKAMVEVLYHLRTLFLFLLFFSFLFFFFFFFFAF